VRVLGWQLHHWLWLVTVAGALAVLPAIIHGPSFYYIDDMQTQFMPAFHEIGRQLWQGRLPLVSLRSWFGGDLVGEYQYAIFNPVSDLLYMLLYRGDLPLGLQATIFAVFHLVNLAAGIFCICRTLGNRFDEALYGSLVVSGAIWLIYWASMSWMPLLVALSWCSWAIVGILLLQENRRWFLASIILVAMVGVSGSPQIDLVLMLFCAVTALQLFLRKERAGFLAIVIASTLGFCLSMPALLPLIEAFAESSRPIAFAPGSYFLPPQAFAAFGLPIFASTWPDWDGSWRTVVLPQAYIDWAFPLLVLSAIGDRRARRDRHFRSLICCAAILLCLIMIPGLSPLRYPMRFFPAASLMSLLAVMRHLALRRADGAMELGWNWRLVAWAIGGPSLVATATSPSFPTFVPYILMGAAAAFGAAVLAMALPPRYRAYWPGLLCLLHCFFFIALVIEWPTNPGITRFAMIDHPTSQTQQIFGNTGNTLLLNQHLSKAAYQHDATKFYGNIPFLVDGRAISGYSALGPKSVTNLFPFKHLGDFLPHDLNWLFEIEPTTSVPYASLFRIDHILAETPDWADKIGKAAPANWLRQTTPNGLLLSTPSKAVLSGGTLSYLPPGVTAELLRFDDNGETWHLAVGDHYDGRPLVFARAWYPGYWASLNGKEVAMDRLAGVVPALVLPAGFEGTFAIRFLPKSLTYGCIAAFLALLISLGLQYFWHSGRRTCENPPVVV
jgi:hypothetical protein